MVDSFQRLVNLSTHIEELSCDKLKKGHDALKRDISDF